MALAGFTAVLIVRENDTPMTNTPPDMIQPDQHLSDVYTRATMLARDLHWTGLPVQDQIGILGGALTEVLRTLPRAEMRLYLRSHIASLCSAFHFRIEVVILVLKSLLMLKP